MSGDLVACPTLRIWSVAAAMSSTPRPRTRGQKKATSFTAEKRFKCPADFTHHGTNQNAPGPDRYIGSVQATSLRTQIDSDKPTAADYSVGAATRRGESRRYISAAHTGAGNMYAMRSGVQSPGKYSPRLLSDGNKGLGDAPLFSFHEGASLMIPGADEPPVPGPGKYDAWANSSVVTDLPVHPSNRFSAVTQRAKAALPLLKSRMQLRPATTRNDGQVRDGHDKKVKRLEKFTTSSFHSSQTHLDRAADVDAALQVLTRRDVRTARYAFNSATEQVKRITGRLQAIADHHVESTGTLHSGSSWMVGRALAVEEAKLTESEVHAKQKLKSAANALEIALEHQKDAFQRSGLPGSLDFSRPANAKPNPVESASLEEQHHKEVAVRRFQTGQVKQAHQIALSNAAWSSSRAGGYQYTASAHLHATPPAPKSPRAAVMKTGIPKQGRPDQLSVFVNKVSALPVGVFEMLQAAKIEMLQASKKEDPCTVRVKISLCLKSTVLGSATTRNIVWAKREKPLVIDENIFIDNHADNVEDTHITFELQNVADDQVWSSCTVPHPGDSLTVGQCLKYDLLEAGTDSEEPDLHEKKSEKPKKGEVPEAPRPNPVVSAVVCFPRHVLDKPKSILMPDPSHAVRVQFSNGDVYNGLVDAEGLPHGEGMMVYSPSGTVYCGAFKAGKRHGYGQIVTAPPLCSEYTGEWFEDQRQGEGNAAFANGVTYQGGWKADVQHGEGIIRWESSARVGTNNDCNISEGQFSVSAYDGGEETADVGDGFGAHDFLCFRGGWVKVRGADGGDDDDGTFSLDLLILFTYLLAPTHVMICLYPGLAQRHGNPHLSQRG